MDTLAHAGCTVHAVSKGWVAEEGDRICLATEE